MVSATKDPTKRTISWGERERERELKMDGETDKIKENPKKPRETSRKQQLDPWRAKNGETKHKWKPRCKTKEKKKKLFIKEKETTEGNSTW